MHCSSNVNCFFGLWVFVQNVKKATSLGEPRKFTVAYLDIGDNIWMRASQLRLLRAWLSVSKAQVQARWVWIPHCVSLPQSTAVQDGRDAMPDPRRAISSFLPNFSPI